MTTKQMMDSWQRERGHQQEFKSKAGMNLVVGARFLFPILNKVIKLARRS